MSGVLGPGDVVSGYVVQSVIAQGGMGVVYLARQERPKRDVALKLIAPERAMDPLYRERFLRESELLANLEHPNIVPIHAAGEWEGQLFLAMRYVPGQTLAERIAGRGRLTPAETMGILRPIADALSAAHEEGIVHRDVKPANILLSTRGHVYLTDFGLTKRTGSDPGLTRPGTALGTEGYMAPEQFTGQVEPALATRIDIYALGCILHACLTGAEPYPRDSYEASLWAHVFSPPPSLATRDPQLAYLDPVLTRAMAKEPSDRFDTADAFINALQLAIAGAPASDPSPSADDAIPPVPARMTLRPKEESTDTVVAAGEPTVIAAPASPRPPFVAIGDGGSSRPALAAGLAGVAGVAGVIILAAILGVGRGAGDGAGARPPSGRPSVATRPTLTPTSSTPTPSLLEPTARLRSMLPSIATGCIQVQGPAANAEIALQCAADTTSGPVNLRYATFTDLSELQVAWAEHVAAYGFGADAGACPTTVGEMSWRAESDAATAVRGRLLCYTSQVDESVVEWTFFDQLVWATAWRAGTDLASLDTVVASGTLDVSGKASR